VRMGALVGGATGRKSKTTSFLDEETLEKRKGGVGKTKTLFSVHTGGGGKKSPEAQRSKEGGIGQKGRRYV